MAQSRRESLGRRLVAGLEELIVDLEAGVAIEKKYKCHRVTLDLQPHAYTAERVRRARRILNASQEVFAKFLGVSVKTVRKWEGGSAPNNLACRFMDEIHRNPDYWKRRLKESITVRTAGGKK
jgi:putative transcriptional regulator